MFYSRRRISVLLFALLLAVLAPLFAPSNRVDAAQDDAAATRILGLINQYRIDSGFWPLRMHPALQAMAEAQAGYIFPIRSQISDEGSFHKDAQGRDARTRARDVFGWTAYGRPDRVEAGENAAEYPVESAFAFWQESGIHRAAALSVAYREVGIAAIPLPNRKNSYLFYMTFGGRPNVLPVLYDPNNNWLYLSADRSRYGPNKDWKDVQVQLLDASQKPLGDAVRWSRTLILPPNVQGTVYVKFTGPGVNVTTKVDLQNDIAILPSTISQMSVSRQSQAVAIAESQPTPVPTAVVANPTATPTPRAGNGATAAPTITPTATATTAATVAPTAISVAEVDLTITYTSKALVVRNTSKKNLNLTTLQVGTTQMQQWLRTASFPVEAFPPNHCLQVLARGVSTAPTPAECRFLRSEVQAINVYWLQGSFDVLYNGDVIQICQATAGKCEVDIP